jgi:hypothetical protein
MEFLNIKNANEAEFKIIAEKLLNHYAIKTHESTYRITNVEFYWYSDAHPDKSVYNRKHVDPKSGEWFFHYSGVDISLRNEDGNGGILIRSIYDVETTKQRKKYDGPQVCAMRLFSGTNAFGDTIQTKLVEHEFMKLEIKEGERKGLGDNAKENDFHKRQYRFFINI